LVEQPPVAQVLRQRDEIDRLPLIVHGDQHLVDRRMRRDVKMFLADALFHTEPAHVLRGQEQRRKDALLRIGALW